MPDDAQQQDGKNDDTSKLIIPDEVKEKYPELLELILKSESMNTEERNYWLQVLPVMTPEQVQELRDILETEKRKLAEIDAKYAVKKKPPEKEIDVEEVERKRREAKEQRKMAEEKHREQEEEHAEDLLSQLDEL